jgi:XTP/dITP diphosphohydrolase
VPGRLALLSTSHRVAPGLLSWPAWSLLQSADRVLVGGVEHPLLSALREAGVAAVVDDGATGGESAALLAGFARDAVVVRVLESDGEPELIAALVARGVALELMPASWDLPGAHVLDLVTVMDRLRSPEGCPWDAEQTHESLVEYLVEEAYETVEAIETGDDAHLREELGDLLLQVAFHARIAQEHLEPWSIDDVADGIVDKLVARHPHVFSDVDTATATQVEANWAALKAAEKGRESVTDGVPAALPALVLAAKLLSRSRSVSVDAVGESDAAAASAALSAVEGDLGSLLLALVVRARADGLDAESALREAIRGYRARVRLAEGLDGGSVA